MVWPGVQVRIEKRKSMSDTLANTMNTGLARPEDTSAALAAQVKATVEARFIMALNRPRDMSMARDRILSECKRPKFAESARYRRPVGKKNGVEQFIEGPSIRFAEAAIRAMGNVDVQTMTTFDSTEKRMVQVTVTDLESNTTFSRDIALLKQVERRFRKEGQHVFSTRLNSYGDTLYTVQATESEVLLKEAAEVSKAIRTLGLRLLPGDILDEAMDLCVATAANNDAKDPDAARKAIADGFSALGVKPSDLKAYLGGQDVGSCSPVQIGELRALYSALKAGEFSWVEAVAPEPKPDGEGSAHGVTSIKARMKERSAAKAAAAAAPAVIDAEGESVPPADGAEPASGQSAQAGNGELTPAQEQEMIAAEAAANAERGNR